MKIPLSKPGTSKENKTGSWRSFRPKLDKEKCIKCGICEDFCPEGCISGIRGNEKPEFPVTDYDYCKGCGICAEQCPKKAIAMNEEKK